MENSLTYTMTGDYLLPNLTLEGQPGRTLGRYGRMRMAYLREHRPVLWGSLSVGGKLMEHCLEIEDTAEGRMELLVPQLAKAAGATERLKAEDMMAWVGLMNSCQAQAEEIVLSELVYS